MVYTRKNTGKAMSMTGGLMVGLLVSVLITGIGTLVLSKLLEMGTLEWGRVGYGIVLLLLCASFLGPLIASVKIKRRRSYVCLMSCGIYFGFLLFVTALFFGGQYEAVGVTAGVVISGGICAAMASAGLEKQGKRGARKRKR